MDIFSRRKRSLIMSRIRSKWTRPEVSAHNILKGCGVRHKMHPAIGGHPDILTKDTGIAIFLDGCFWHGCPRHYRKPKSNSKFWRKKIETNIARDRAGSMECRKAGYRVRRIWECRLSSASLLAVVGAV